MRVGGCVAVIFAGAMTACSAITDFSGLIGSADAADSGSPPDDAADGGDVVPVDSSVVSSSNDSSLPCDDCSNDASTSLDSGKDSGSDSGSVGQGPPPINFVQANATKPTTAVTPLAFKTNVTAGNALIVCVNYPMAAGTLTSVTDTLGNTYLPVMGPISGAGDYHYVVAALNSPAGADTVTVTLAAAPSGGSDMFIHEYSGIAHSAAFDLTSFDTGTVASMQSGSVTTTFAHELIFGYAEAPSAVAGAGFTGRTSQSGNLTEDQVVHSTGSYQTTATTGAGSWTMLMATFKGQ